MRISSTIPEKPLSFMSIIPNLNTMMTFGRGVVEENMKSGEGRGEEIPFITRLQYLLEKPQSGESIQWSKQGKLCFSLTS